MARENPAQYKYASTHEWIKVEGATGICGITDHAQQLLTDIVFVEIPDIGKKVTQGQKVAVVESVKSVSDIYAPVSGEITEVNVNLKDSPEIINSDPFNAGWIFKIAISDAKELDRLLPKADYQASIQGEAH